MSEGSFASLGPTLLARKGGARPAMRPQMGALAGLAGLTGTHAGPGAGANSAAPNLEDLGWNDMGDDEDFRESEAIHLTPAPANEETAAQSVANDQQAQADIGRSADGPASHTPAIHAQQAAITDRLNEAAKLELAQDSSEATDPPVPAQTTVSGGEAIAPPSPKPSAKPVAQLPAKPAAAIGKRTAFTLRLDPERHLKLRLASAMKNRSAQAIVTQALDALLADIEGLDLLAATAGTKAANA